MSETGLAVKANPPTIDFDLASYLHSRIEAVARALESYLKRDAEVGGAIGRAMQYGLFPGGKRVRPILVLAAGEIFGAPRKVLLPFACAVEMIHGYSLIHDDLPALDNDDLRRGAPTNHKVYGEGMALLAGDGLLTEAFHVMTGPEVAKLVAPHLVLQLVHELSHAVGVAGLVGGQALDLEAERREVDIGAVEAIHARKTGALIRASVRIGAQVAGAKPAELRRVSRFGECLGLAFQIADDILDVRGETAPGERAESGHSENHKATFPSVIGMAAAHQRLAALREQCLRELSPFGAGAEPLREMARQVAERALTVNGELPSKEMQS